VIRIGELLADATLCKTKAAAVKCSRCGKNFDSSRDAIARYFSEGWPICCGETAQFALLGVPS